MTNASCALFLKTAKVRVLFRRLPIQDIATPYREHDLVVDFQEVVHFGVRVWVAIPMKTNYLLFVTFTFFGRGSCHVFRDLFLLR